MKQDLSTFIALTYQGIDGSHSDALATVYLPYARDLEIIPENPYKFPSVPADRERTEEESLNILLFKDREAVFHEMYYREVAGTLAPGGALRCLFTLGIAKMIKDDKLSGYEGFKQGVDALMQIVVSDDNADMSLEQFNAIKNEMKSYYMMALSFAQTKQLLDEMLKIRDEPNGDKNNTLSENLKSLSTTFLWKIGFSLNELKAIAEDGGIDQINARAMMALAAASKIIREEKDEIYLTLNYPGERVAGWKQQLVAEAKKDVPAVAEKDVPAVAEKDVPAVAEKDVPAVAEKPAPQKKVRESFNQQSGAKRTGVTQVIASNIQADGNIIINGIQQVDSGHGVYIQRGTIRTSNGTTTRTQRVTGNRISGVNMSMGDGDDNITIDGVKIEGGSVFIGDVDTDVNFDAAFDDFANDFDGDFSKSFGGNSNAAAPQQTIGADNVLFVKSVKSGERVKHNGSIVVQGDIGSGALVESTMGSVFCVGDVGSGARVKARYDIVVQGDIDSALVESALGSVFCSKDVERPRYH
ncbi:MAG: hypothetical protein ACOYK8_01055 [Alphaproteobacteria bacterium]